MRARLGINNCFAVKCWPRPDDWAQIVREELGLDVLLVLEVIPAFEQDDEQVLADLRTSAELGKAAPTERGAR
jgi:hypothetical protein